MSRLLSVLIAVIIILIAFLTFRYFKNDQNTTITSPAVQRETDFHNWREFTSKTEHFKVLLPSLPQHLADTITDPKSHEQRKFDTYMTVDDKGQGFIINSIVLPKTVVAQELDTTLKSVVNDMLARNANNKLLSMNPSTFHNLKALDFSYTNGEFLISGKVFVQDKMLYVLSMIDKTESFMNQELEFFINSFDVVDDETLKNPL